METIKDAIDYLLKINELKAFDYGSDFNTFRALMNITMPEDLSDEYYNLQDKILQDDLKTQKITKANDLEKVFGKICLYLGDITKIEADAIVNAGNKKLLGCFTPLHKCIDNAIHSFAGLQVRRDLMKVMEKQGCDEKNGGCKVTYGYNLPAKYIFHTIGPLVIGGVTLKNEQDLISSYYSCLEMANKMELKTIVFCSISTGVFGYPIEEASLIAIETIQKFFKDNKNTSIKKVIINLFSEKDYEIYNSRLKKMNNLK